ncbi:MAG: hypothetical protein CMM10_11450 [Rhodospirillaceae bacterium]|nr:hypothetical protein [Rhodospirillaceae bacterium]
MIASLISQRRPRPIPHKVSASSASVDTWPSSRRADFAGAAFGLGFDAFEGVGAPALFAPSPKRARNSPMLR